MILKIISHCRARINGLLYAGVKLLKALVMSHMIVNPYIPRGTSETLTTDLAISIELRSLDWLVDQSSETPNALLSRNVVPSSGSIQVYSVDDLLFPSSIEQKWIITYLLLTE